LITASQTVATLPYGSYADPFLLHIYAALASISGRIRDFSARGGAGRKRLGCLPPTPCRSPGWFAPTSLHVEENTFQLGVHQPSCINNTRPGSYELLQGSFQQQACAQSGSWQPSSPSERRPGSLHLSTRPLQRCLSQCLPPQYFWIALIICKRRFSQEKLWRDRASLGLKRAQRTPVRAAASRS
jgi:hypothetical protein